MNFRRWANKVAGRRHSSDIQRQFELVLSELDRARRFGRPLSLIAFDIADNVAESAARKKHKNSTNKDRGSRDRLILDNIAENAFKTLHSLSLYSEHNDSADAIISQARDLTRAHDVVFPLTYPRPIIVFVCPETNGFAAHLAAKRLRKILSDDTKRYGIASFPSDGVSIPALVQHAAKNVKNPKERGENSAASDILARNIEPKEISEEIATGTGR